MASYGRVDAGFGGYVCYAQGVTERLVSDETIRCALKRLEINWKRAIHWITSPNLPTCEKKVARSLDRAGVWASWWVLGFQDEVWWSCYAQLYLQTWTDDKSLRRITTRRTARTRADRDGVYGDLRTDTQGMLCALWMATDQCVTIQFVQWVTDRLAAEGKTALLMVWDNASWHISQTVRAWRKAHNRRVKRDGGVGWACASCRLKAHGSIVLAEVGTCQARHSGSRAEVAGG